MRPNRTNEGRHEPDRAAQQAVLDFLGQSRDPRRRERQAHRHPCRRGLPGRPTRAQDQARGALSVPRLFHAGEAQSRLRGRDRGQPAVRAGDLSRRGRDHARARRRPRHRRRGRAGGMGGGDAALRRNPDARSSGRARRDRRARSPTRSAARWRKAHAGGAGRAPDLSRELADDHRAERRRVARRPRPVSRAGKWRRWRKARAQRFTRVRPLLEARERDGRVRALPRRSASRQYRAARRRAGAVRRHRIRPAARHRRRVLRSRLPADGPDRART